MSAHPYGLAWDKPLKEKCLASQDGQAEDGEIQIELCIEVREVCGISPGGDHVLI